MLEILICCVTIISCVAIISYAISYVLTHPNFIKTIKEFSKNEYEWR